MHGESIDACTPVIMPSIRAPVIIPPILLRVDPAPQRITKLINHNSTISSKKEGCAKELDIQPAAVVGSSAV